MVDIILVNPPSPNESVIIRDFNRSGRTSKEKIIWPQTSLAYLAAMVPKNLSVKIIDCIAEKYNWDQFLKVLQEEKPKYFISHVITSVSTNDFKAYKYAKSVSNCITISMGPHVTKLTENSFRRCPELDFILLGEPEITFQELILALENQKDLSTIKGLAFKKEDEIKINSPRPFVENLDELPIPRQDLLPINKYVFPFIASNFTFVITSRGCPYPCTFCRQPIMWEGKVRTRSVKNVMEELLQLKKMGINHIIFHSDTFTIKKDWIIQLCQEMIKEQLNISWGCNSRVDTVNKEMLQWMKKAGCWMIAYGIESGSSEILKKCKKEATVKQSIDAINWSHEIGIKNYGYFVIGLPGETKETIQETIDLAKMLPITFAIFHVASPYPGTEFYNQCVENNWLTAKKWEDINQGGNSPINYPQLSGKEIMQGIKKAYFSFYLRPKAVFNVCKEVKNFKDFKHLFNLSIEHLKW